MNNDDELIIENATEIINNLYINLFGGVRYMEIEMEIEIEDNNRDLILNKLLDVKELLYNTNDVRDHLYQIQLARDYPANYMPPMPPLVRAIGSVKSGLIHIRDTLNFGRFISTLYYINSTIELIDN